MIWCRRVLLSLAALLVCMPADREGERVGHSNFLRLYRSNFTDWVVGGGRKGCRRLLLSEAALLVYMPAGRKASTRDFFWGFPVQVLRTGCWGRKRGYRRLSTLSGRALVCMSRGQKPERVVFHSFGCSTSSERGAVVAFLAALFCRWWHV